MTKQTEALKLALGALESGVKTTANRISWTEYDSWLMNDAITAIKEALTSTQCEKQPAQEPDELTIAYMSGFYDGKKKRPWVGLTDEEIKKIVGPYGDMPIKGYTRKLFDQIETKLKELNT